MMVAIVYSLEPCNSPFLLISTNNFDNSVSFFLATYITITIFVIFHLLQDVESVLLSSNQVFLTGC